MNLVYVIKLVYAELYFFPCREKGGMPKRHFVLSEVFGPHPLGGKEALGAYV
jgi:hypothetical protein